MVFGVKIFALIQKTVMILALGGAVVVTGAITFTSKASFVESWDSFAAEYDSLTYAEVVPAVSAAIGLAASLGINWAGVYSGTVTTFAPHPITDGVTGLAYIGGTAHWRGRSRPT